MQKVLVPIVAVLCLGFLGFVGYLFWSSKQQEQQPPAVAQAPVRRGPQQPVRPSPGPQVGQQAPEIIGEDVDGKEFKLSDYRGKVVVLDFWGFW